VEKMRVKFSIEQGVLHGATQLTSTNFNARPSDCAIELLVVHNISLPPGQFGGGYVVDFFHNNLDRTKHPYFEKIADLQVSAHLFISRTGDTTQFVNFEQRAWHAGVSSFNGRKNCNDFSIGIELEGTDELAYERIQYQRLADISYLLQQAYPMISAATTLGHCDIAPVRKTDPGKVFDWVLYGKLWADLKGS
jgi:AmpD protein